MKYAHDIVELNEMIPGRIYRDLIRAAKRSCIYKLVLFGSRARKTNSPKSDIDLAVYGGNFDTFYDEIQNNTWSLLMFDLINMDTYVSKDLKREIQKDGIIVYEKNRELY